MTGGLSSPHMPILLVGQVLFLGSWWVPKVEQSTLSAFVRLEVQDSFLKHELVGRFLIAKASLDPALGSPVIANVGPPGRD